MPFETWDNLPEEKRTRISAVMTAEFATHGYVDASLNRIAATAEVSKGSLFQYFSNKLDMWDWTSAASAKRTWDECAHAAGPPDRPVDERLAALALAWVRYLRDNDVDRALGAATIDANASDARRLFRESSNELYGAKIGEIVADAVARGDVLSKDTDNFATMTILVLRFLANAPFSPDRDPVLGLHERSWDEVEAAADDLIRSMVRAFLVNP